MKEEIAELRKLITDHQFEMILKEICVENWKVKSLLEQGNTLISLSYEYDNNFPRQLIKPLNDLILPKIKTVIRNNNLNDILNDRK